MKHFAPILLVFLGLSGACGKSNFKGGVNQGKTPEPQAAAATPKSVLKTQEFALQKEGAPMDILWVIDNSGSMQEETDQVRKNFATFTQSVADRADVQLTVISGNDPEFGIQLDAAAVAKGHMQLPIEVGSNNLLDLAAAALCEEASTEMQVGGDPLAGDTPGKICNLPILNTESPEDVTAIKGKLKSRFRAGSQRIIVFVTDDNAEDQVTSGNFIGLIGGTPANTHVFAFRGLKASSVATCDIAADGIAYNELAAKSGGAVFDICESDWSANMKKLSENILTLRTKSFKINATGAFTVKKVLVGTTELLPTQYTVQNGEVVLKDDNLDLKVDKISIVYEVTVP